MTVANHVTARFRHVVRFIFFVIAILAVPVGSSRADLLTWTNADGDLRWSTAGNWSPNSMPTAADSVLFGNALGFTNAFGMVNNIVDSSRTVSNFTYEAVANGYHHTLIQPGVTLTVDSSQLTGNEANFMFRKEVGLNEQMYATIRGTNASLVIGIPSVINTAFGFSTYATSSNVDPSVSSHRATLDLSGLDNFAFWGGYILIGGSGSPGANDQPSGTLLLARTNMIVAGRSVAVSSAGTIRIGNCLTGNGTGQGENLIELGQENTICGEYLRIGGAQARNGGAMRFRSGQTNPTLKLRAPDQSSRMPLLTLGDNNATITAIPSTGILDLSGGIVDALVNALHVGRSYTTADATRNGSGNGSLTFSAGTLDVTTLNIGCQSANNLASSTGVVRVVNSGLLVAGNINIGNDTGTRTGTGVGALNVGGGTVSVTGNILENNSGGGNGSSVINLTNGTIATSGNIMVDTLNYHGGTIATGGALGLTNLNVRAPATAFTVLPGQNLAPNGANSAGPLTVNGSLILSNATLRFDLSSGPASRDQMNVTGNLKLTGINSVDFNLTPPLTNGSYTIATCGSLTGGPANLQVTGAAANSSYLFTFTNSGTNLLVLVGTNYVAPHSNLLARVVGNATELSWHPMLTGWELECQTNSLGIGLSTNWFPVIGSEWTNRWFMPNHPAAGVVLYRLRALPTMKEQRLAAANRPRRIIFNNDGGEPARSMTSPTVQNLLELRTLGLEGTQFDMISYTPRTSGFGLVIYFTSIGSIFTSTNASYGNNMMGPLLEAGIDPLRVMNEFANSNNIEFFCNFRMNDTHDGGATGDGPVIFAANALKVNHPEWLIGSASSQPTYGEWTAVDYARPEIRDYAVRFAEEVCTNYNVDGLEFDFFRHPVFFKSTGAGSQATAAERAMMTELMQRIRIMADEVGWRRGRPILISMRVPDSVSYCRAIGIELDIWLANDLLDILVVSSYYKLNDWDYSVALARQYGVKIYPSLDECRLSDATAKSMRSTDLAYRGRAANIWGFGADGVYMFNFSDPTSLLWVQLGSTQTLASLDKDYFGTIRGAVNAAGGNLPYSSYQTIEKLNPSITKTISPGGSSVSRINVGEDLSQAGPVNLKFRLQFSTAPNPAFLTVTCNNQPLTFTGTNLNWVEYSASPSVIQQVTNHVRVVLSPSSPSVTWRDLMLELRH